MDSQERYRRASGPWTLGLLLASLLPAALAAAPLDDAEERGKQIYLEGTSPRGNDITAVVGDEGARLPGAAMPCGSCHGNDGLGRPEGGVLPVDIRWSVLTKSYGHVHDNGRRHPAFDEDSFIRSMVGGVDPAGNLLDRSMPLYQMSDADLADLVAYMKVLERDFDPGISDKKVQLASLLPVSGAASEMGQAMARIMQGYFQQINAQGGIFGREIELLVVPRGASTEESIVNLQLALEDEGVFAVVGAYSIGLDTPLLDALRADKVPLIAPFTLDPGDAFIDAAAFYLYPSFTVQAEVLADRALDGETAAADIRIVGAEGPRYDDAVAAAKSRLRQQSGSGDAGVERYTPGESDGAALAGRLGDAQAVIFLGPQEDLEQLLASLDESERAPRVYVLSSLLARPLFSAPATFDQRIFIAYPTLGGDISAKGYAEYQRLASAYSLPASNLQAQMAALAAAKLAVEGLRRAGRNLSRIRLVDGLEQLYEFDTGVTPPLSYGPNRRIGALGAHIVAVDIENERYVPESDTWVELR